MTEAQQSSGDVAVFIDFENIYISVRNRYDANPNFESIMDLCQNYGRVTIARAYADWYRYPRVTNALYANAIEPMYVPTYHYDREEGRTGRAIKNAVDMHLCIDCMKTLYAYPTIDTYVLITGDRDFIPLINAVRQQGKRTVVIGVAQATASHLAQAADEFIYYSQVVEDVAETGEQKDPYEVLVEAIRVARQRGHVSTLATLKLLMLELMPKFDERRFKDGQGRAFSKFKDFVNDAQRRGVVQIFTSGSVNEIFLPDEDPYEVSRFAPERPQAAVAMEAEIADDTPPREGFSLSSKDWAVFEEAMRQFDEPVLFIQIYDALRGLRNKEIIDLSNSDIKQMVKLAINEGLLLRSTRGSHAYYQIDPDRPFSIAAERATDGAGPTE
ncbi:MAG: NYN domain-containing protein [Anaerolineae bacterium]